MLNIDLNVCLNDFFDLFMIKYVPQFNLRTGIANIYKKCLQINKNFWVPGPEIFGYPDLKFGSIHDADLVRRSGPKLAGPGSV